MSPAARSRPRRLARTFAETLRRDADRTVAGAVGVLQFLAFWTAALLPFAYLPLLATGFVERHPLAFGGLLLANVVAFRLGHGYGREGRRA